MKDCLSIVVPCKNEEHYIGHLLDSLRDQVSIDGVKIIIADASTDNTREVIRDLKGDLNVDIVEGGPVSVAKNNGAEIVDTPYLLFIDSDVRFFSRTVIIDTLSDLINRDPHAKVIHVDIDPAEIGKIRHAEVPIVGDVKDVLGDLLAAFNQAAKAHKPDYSAWWERLNFLREQYPLGYDEPDDGLLSPQWVIQKIGEMSGPDAVFAAGVGQHQMWAAQFIQYERPNAWLNSGGAGTMGYAVPAAMGAKVAEPDRLVWAIDGDGCFQMTNQELATCTINNIPIKVAIINNSSLGMVRQWQSLFYDGRHSFTDLDTGHDTVMVPDFMKLAESYGALGIRVRTKEEVEPAIKLAMETNDRPVLIDFIVSKDSMVWPMVPQGVGNSQVQYARDHAPEWDEE